MSTHTVYRIDKETVLYTTNRHYGVFTSLHASNVLNLHISDILACTDFRLQAKKMQQYYSEENILNLLQLKRELENKHL